MKQSVALLLHDYYNDRRRAGQVIGSTSDDGHCRQGADAEGVIGIDNGALRIQPLARPGWGRAGIAYGPYKRSNGLALAVTLLNGHNTSQYEPLPEGMLRRLWRWARGSEANSLTHRAFNFLRSGNKRQMVRRLYYWFLSNDRGPAFRAIDENLAVGWFPTAAPDSPLSAANDFVVHAAGPDNGELWANVGGRPLPLFNGLQNIPVVYLIILREQGAAYYAASLPAAHGLTAFPTLRPLAIDPFSQIANVYPGVHQSTLGQIGFRVDTRLYELSVAQLDDYATWYGSAHAADRLTGSAMLAGSAGETGGVWQVDGSPMQRTARGAQAQRGQSFALLSAPAVSGLIHVLLETGDINDGAAGLIWRGRDLDNHWRVRVSDSSCDLLCCEQGVVETVATTTEQHWQANHIHSLQVLDDGERFSVYLDGVRLFDRDFADARLQAFCAVGVYGAGESTPGLRNFEAHPRQLELPAPIAMPAPVYMAGDRLCAADTFDGPPVALDQHVTSSGDKRWRHELGSGILRLTGAGSVAVQASVQQPNPGRTAYTIAWEQPDFADLAVTITPPGLRKGAGERGRGGLIFWQDPDNYITISNWLDDHYSGASLSSFFHIGGFEELYDAVWTNVGGRVSWGVPHRLRVVFDGMHYLASIDDEPVLYRALSDVYPTLQPLRIRRVGIVANWEWGNDTGSQFERFVASKRLLRKQMAAHGA